jgi:GNAT superfamily N-acetyltransferase
MTRIRYGLVTESPQPASPFRFATGEDAESILAIVEAAYRATGEGAGWTTESHLLAGRRTGIEEVRALISSETGGLLTFRDGDVVVASCHLDRRAGHAYFGMFAVTPGRQAQGLGKGMLAEAERIARDEWRMTEMRLTVLSVRGDLIAWYERRGFAPTGQTSPFPYGDERFGVPRVDDLRFVELAKLL